jgi:periplasmic protein CpxP/Spy
METKMTDMNTNNQTPKTSFFNGISTWKIAGLVVLSALAGAALSRGAHHWRHYNGWSHAMSGPIDPADVDRRVEWMTSKLAKHVDATAEQRDKLAVIAKAAAQDMQPMRETMRDARVKARELLANATVDRAAIETLRAGQMANADAMSKRVSTALADAADILTLDQRKALAERMEKRHRGWWGWRHGPDKG